MAHLKTSHRLIIHNMNYEMINDPLQRDTYILRSTQEKL